MDSFIIIFFSLALLNVNHPKNRHKKQRANQTKPNSLTGIYAYLENYPHQV